MRSFSRALVVFSLLCASAALGFMLKSQLLGPYTQTEALNFLGVIIGFLVTIASIVMGLMISAAKNFIETTEDRWAKYAALLIRLDQSMRNYGPGSEPIRRRLQSFTAAGIVNFWRHESIPAGVSYVDVREKSRADVHQVLTDTLNRIKLDIFQLKPSDPLHERLAADCIDQYKDFAMARWSLVMEPERSIPAPFLRMLMSWLMIIFLCFGLRTTASPLVIIAIALAGITLSSMTFTIADMVDPYEGRFNISSKSMRNALDVMLIHNITPTD
ncbi:hypothetical protein GCM10009641_67570 [Mycobacterium cookii]|uniref:DUF4239 domain-containing protein n=2 Tax=Mycobacterium cookii TaxID=1775 RepID=A0A7I7KQV6_9MYCO|nr:hypothetical protein MCOO_01590 [Mycobacterium cookii]